MIEVIAGGIATDYVLDGLGSEFEPRAREDYSPWPMGIKQTF
jgi:hypothetical protein